MVVVSGGEVESGLAAAIEAAARSIQRGDWARLRRILAPGYTARRGIGRWLSAEEEIARLRDELRNAGCRHRYRLYPVSGELTDAGWRGVVREQVVTTWPDGCIRTVERLFEQSWRRDGGRWTLQESVMVSRESSRWTSGLRQPEMIELAELLEDSDRPRRSRRSRVPWWLPPPLSPELRVRVISPGLPPHAAEAVRRASEAAVEAWNESLRGVTSLVVRESGDADFLIRGVAHLPYGSNGVFLPGRTPSGFPAEIRLSAAEHAGPSALCRSPMELYATACHELGHGFGLSDCEHQGMVMASHWCSAGEPPAPPFASERAAILGWLAARAKICRHYGHAEEESRLPVGDPAPAGDDFLAVRSLEESSYAPPPVRAYWRGSEALRKRSYPEAVEAYTEALATLGPTAEVLFRRGCARSQSGDPGGLDDLEAAVAAAPDWLCARWHLAELVAKSGHRTRTEEERRCVRALELEHEAAWAAFNAGRAGARLPFRTSQAVRARWLRWKASWYRRLNPRSSSGR